MKRNENETFDAYKARRAIANEAVKNINAASKGAGRSTPSPRIGRPNKGKVAASYAESIRMYFAKKTLAKLKGKK